MHTLLGEKADFWPFINCHAWICEKAERIDLFYFKTGRQIYYRYSKPDIAKWIIFKFLFTSHFSLQSEALRQCIFCYNAMLFHFINSGHERKHIYLLTIWQVHVLINAQMKTMDKLIWALFTSTEFNHRCEIW